MQDALQNRQPGFPLEVERLRQTEWQDL
jgi:hypothetical protein